MQSAAFDVLRFHLIPQDKGNLIKTNDKFTESFVYGVVRELWGGVEAIISFILALKLITNNIRTSALFSEYTSFNQRAHNTRIHNGILCSLVLILYSNLA